MKSVIAVMLVFVMMFCSVGCDTSWVAKAQAINAALLPSVANVLTLIMLFDGKTGLNVNSLAAAKLITTEVNTDLQLIGDLLNQYNSASAADKATILGKIDVAISAVSARLNDLVPALHITDLAMQNKITLVVGVILSEVQAIRALLPMVNGGKVQAVKVRKVRLAKDYKRAFNEAMTSPTGNPTVDSVTGTLVLK